jgi:polar amino acid transport system substrate-binding protein
MNRPTVRLRRVAAGLVLAVAAALLVACGGSTSSVRTPAPAARFEQKLHNLLPLSVRNLGFLRVGTDASYAPMSAFGPDGLTIIGMEPDLGVQMERILGVRLLFRNTDFATLRDRVASGELDLAISAMTDTPERARTADFVNYFRAGTSIVVQRGNPAGITELNDLCGKQVAVESGTTQVDLLTRTQKNCVNKPIIMKTYPTNSDALVQLRTGRALAVLNDYPPAVFLVNDVRTRSQYQLASTMQYEPGLYGIVVAKTQPGLRDAVQGALDQLLASGVYARILDRWHIQDGAVQQITINSGR